MSTDYDIRFCIDIEIVKLEFEPILISSFNCNVDYVEQQTYKIYKRK